MSRTWTSLVGRSYDLQAQAYAESTTLQSGNLSKLIGYRQQIVGKLPVSRVLDVGAGAASVLHELSGRALLSDDALYCGIDLSFELLKVGRKRAPRPVNISVADASHLPFLAESFDSVVSNSVLHWLNVPEQRQTPESAIFEMSRVLEDGGLMALSVSAFGTARRFQQAYHRVLCALSDRRGFRLADVRRDPIGSVNLVDLVDWVEAAGLEVLLASLDYEPVRYASTDDYVSDVRAYGYLPYLAIFPSDEREQIWSRVREEFRKDIPGEYRHDQYMSYIIARKTSVLSP